MGEMGWPNMIIKSARNLGGRATRLWGGAYSGLIQPWGGVNPNPAWEIKLHIS